MSSSRPFVRLSDIQQNIDLIERFTSGRSYDAFVADDRTVYACMHALLIISEAAAKLGDEAETLAPGPRWSAIRRFGNIARHEYDRIDLDIVWELITGDQIADLKAAVSKALANRPA